MSARERERAAVVAWLDAWADVPGRGDYAIVWAASAFNAARAIERGDHLPRVSRSGVPLTRRRT